MCTVLNVLTIIFMATLIALILNLTGLDITVSVIIAIVLIFPLAWVEERYLSRFINKIVSRITKY